MKLFNNTNSFLMLEEKSNSFLASFAWLFSAMLLCAMAGSFLTMTLFTLVNNIVKVLT